ncbi:MAG: YkgJ family cysteine cluster protein [Ferruginibacter sp.]
MQFNETALDNLTVSINNEVSPLIDCTACGACCRNLMIHVTPEENKRIADTLNMSKESFENQYVESGNAGTQIINAVPCHFLCDSKCRVYEHRYADCRAFPNLDQPRFKTRLFATLMHYGMCPIIFNVVEQLKIATNFFNEQLISHES